MGGRDGKENGVLRMTTPGGRCRLRVGSGPKRSSNCISIRVDRVDGVNTAKDIFVISLLASVAWSSVISTFYTTVTSNIRFNILLLY